LVGAEIEDVEGRGYVDWVMSGPLIFGHADPETLAAVVEAAERESFAPRPGRGRARRGDRRRRPSVEMVTVHPGRRRR
jgi:glutamate-1-semialdehyde aminotransferase